MVLRNRIFFWFGSVPNPSFSSFGTPEMATSILMVDDFFMLSAVYVRAAWAWYVARPVVPGRKDYAAPVAVADVSRTPIRITPRSLKVAGRRCSRQHFTPRTDRSSTDRSSTYISSTDRLSSRFEPAVVMICAECASSTDRLSSRSEPAVVMICAESAW